jgi:hypothetical protein
MASSLFDSVFAFLETDGWHPEVVEPGALVRFGFIGKNARFMCFAQAYEERTQLVVHTMIPFRVPDSARAEAIEFVTRANYGMILGNFEIDLRDGEIRYKTSIDTGGLPFTPELAGPLFYGNALTADRYMPGLMSVISGGKSAIDAIATVEGAAAEG